MEITKKMGIKEIVEKKPKAAEIMMQHGMHCLGCMASQFESLEQGCAAHGMDEKQVDKMIEEINKAKE